MLQPTLTDKDAKVMENFSRTPTDSLNLLGQDLLRQVMCCLEFYKQVCKIPACTKVCLSTIAPSAGTLTVVKNADPFLHSFVKLYKGNKDMRESLIMGLLHVILEKVNGDINPRLPEKDLIFFIASDAIS